MKRSFEMPTYYVKRTADSKPEPGENWLVWFSGEGIEGCSNALLLYGSGEIHLLKTERIVSKEELDTLDFENWTSQDYKKREELVGKGAAASELRTAFRHFMQVNK
jgi:hypothetical protein